MKASYAIGGAYLAAGVGIWIWAKIQGKKAQDDYHPVTPPGMPSPPQPAPPSPTWLENPAFIPISPIALPYLMLGGPVPGFTG